MGDQCGSAPCSPILDSHSVMAETRIVGAPECSTTALAPPRYGEQTARNPVKWEEKETMLNGGIATNKQSVQPKKHSTTIKEAPNARHNITDKH